jgi:hypothetical protein
VQDADDCHHRRGDSRQRGAQLRDPPHPAPRRPLRQAVPLPRRRRGATPPPALSEPQGLGRGRADVACRHCEGVGGWRRAAFALSPRGQGDARGDRGAAPRTWGLTVVLTGGRAARGVARQYEPGFFSGLTSKVVEILGDAFPELRSHPGTSMTPEKVAQVILEEEVRSPRPPPPGGSPVLSICVARARLGGLGISTPPGCPLGPCAVARAAHERRE